MRNPWLNFLFGLLTIGAIAVCLILLVTAPWALVVVGCGAVAVWSFRRARRPRTTR